MKRTQIAQSAAALALVAVASNASAALDTTAVTAYFTSDINPAIVAVGGVLLLAAVTAVGFKWIKGMIFG